jgi:Restriction endonuclease
MSDWRQYESEIYELLIAKAEPGAVVDFDVHKDGQLSGTRRQIDVWLQGTLAGGVLPDPVTVAVDCKCWSATVNVPEVERFIGTLEDVGADIGLLVTTSGFSQAARTRAKRARGVQLEVLTFEELAEWSPDVEWCTVCNDEDSDAMPGMFYVERLESGPTGERLMVGACDRCGAVHLRCSCGALNGVYEAEEGTELECLGCGRAFRVDPIELDRDAIPTNESAQLRVHVVAEPPI